MARLTYQIRLDTSGLQPMHACMASLAEALNVAQFDGPIDLETASDGWRYLGGLIAKLDTLGPKDGVYFLRAVPTFNMPLFAADICRFAPGVKVRWDGGWPHFSASDDHDPAEDGPSPLMPELLTC